MHLQRIANTFIQMGYSTVNFDATNSRGESGSDEVGITFTGHYQDLEDVIHWAKMQSRYQEPFVLAGHSLGGMAVIYYTQQHPGQVKTLIPISTALSGDIFIEARKHTSLSAFEEREENGFYLKEDDLYTKHSQPPSTLKIPFNFVEDMKNYDCFSQSEKIVCSTLFINVDEDNPILLKYTKMFYDSLKCPKEMIILENCTHAMNTEKNLQDLELALSSFIETNRE